MGMVIWAAASPNGAPHDQTNTGSRRIPGFHLTSPMSPRVAAARNVRGSASGETFDRTAGLKMRRQRMPIVLDWLAHPCLAGSIVNVLNRETAMRKFAFTVIVVLGGFVVTDQANAAACVNGVYRAGCTGPSGTTVVRKHPYAHPYHRGTVNCASGPYRAGCAGPNGAAVVHRPY